MKIYQLFESPDLIHTSQFKAWFKNSKIVDSNGNPLRVYHGTNQEIKSFKHDRLGAATSAASAIAFFFTDDPNEAGEYANNAANKVWANAAEVEKKSAELTRKMNQAEKRNDWDAYEKYNLELEKLELGAVYAEPSGANTIPVYLSMQNPEIIDVNGMISTGEVSAIIANAKKSGKDGLILKNINDRPSAYRSDAMTNQFVVFKSTQIKSAIGNKGNYSRRARDISESLTE